jgi:hypothetical protein
MAYSRKMIQLLDGSQEEKLILEEQAIDDDFYYGYLGKAALSSSSLKQLLQSPKTYHYLQKYAQQDTKSLLIGKLFHWAILEPHKMDEVHVVDVQSRNAKAFKEAKEEHSMVITKKEEEEIRRLQDAMLRNEKVLSYLKGAQFEVPCVDMLGGYAFRAKADIIQDGHIIDLKSTTDLNAFRYSARKYGYDVQCYLYCNLFDIPYQNFHFAAIDKGSLDIGVYHVSEEFYLAGREKVQQALERYKTFFVDKNDIDSYYIEDTL